MQRYGLLGLILLLGLSACQKQGEEKRPQISPPASVKKEQSPAPKPQSTETQKPEEKTEEKSEVPSSEVALGLSKRVEEPEKTEEKKPRRTYSVIESFQNHSVFRDLRAEHPRILWTKEEEARLRSLSEKDPLVPQMIEWLKRDGDEMLGLPVVVYKTRGKEGILQDTARPAFRRITTLSFLFR